MQPKFTKTYCLPFRTNNPNLDCDEYTMSLYIAAHESLLVICYNGTQVVDCMPEEFLYEKEITELEELILQIPVAEKTRKRATPTKKPLAKKIARKRAPPRKRS